MSEKEFYSFKKAIFVAVGSQIFIFIITGLIYMGSFKAEAGRNAQDIDQLKTELKTKADINTVMRIKTDTDIRNQMILDELKDLKACQRQIYDKLIGK